jgi:hypothetical protein
MAYAVVREEEEEEEEGLYWEGPRASVIATPT